MKFSINRKVGYSDLFDVLPPPAQCMPLSDEQIKEAVCDDRMMFTTSNVPVVDAVERAHGIFR